MALWYGADDADGLVQQYEITYKEGEWGNKRQHLTHENMIAMIEEAGRVAVERDSLYNEITAEQLASTVARRPLEPLPLVR
jgi:aminodeoxyfutalosine synthase